MKLLIVLCAVIAVAVASAYGGGNNYPSAGYPSQHNNYDFNPFYKPHHRHHRHGRHGRHGRHHRRHHHDSSDSDSDSHSHSSSSSGSHSYERDDYYHYPMPYPVHHAPSYGNVANDAPAATVYGAPANNPPAAPAPIPWGNTFGQ